MGIRKGGDAGRVKSELKVILAFFYRIADRAVKPCRSSRSTTRGGTVKDPLTLAKQENKQTQTPQTKQSQTKHKTAKPPTSGKCQGEGETDGEKEVKRPKHS